MNDEIILAILSSSVLSAFVTTFIQSYIKQREINISNITSERKNWREFLRAIVAELNGDCTNEELSILISKIKVRINAYGNYKFDNYLFDGYLWELLESDIFSNDFDLTKYKKKITDLISALLKFDWERTKLEIRGNVKLKSVVVIYIISNSICVSTLYWLNDTSTQIVYFYNILGNILITFTLYYSMFKLIEIVVFKIKATDKFLIFSLLGIFAAIILVFMADYIGIRTLARELDKYFIRVGLYEDFYRSVGAFYLFPSIIAAISCMAHTISLIKNRILYNRVINKILEKEYSKYSYKNNRNYLFILRYLKKILK